MRIKNKHILLLVALISIFIIGLQYYISIYNSKSFSGIKNEVLTSLQEEKKYIIDTKLKNKIDKSIKRLSNIEIEKDFFELLSKEYEVIDKAFLDSKYSINGNLEYDTIEKLNIIDSLSKEIGSIDNNILKNKLLKEIVSISKENDILFYDGIETIYEKLDLYYEKNNIDYIEQGGGDNDFLSIKEELLGIIQDKVSQKEFNRLLSIQKEDTFFNELNTIYDGIFSNN